MERKRRQRGSGSIYTRGSTLWIGYRIGKKLIRERARTNNRRVAQALLNKRLGDISRGAFVAPHVAERIRFEDLVSILLRDYRVNRRRSIQRVDTATAHLRAFFGQERAVDITTDQIDKYIEERQAGGAADATIQNELAALKRAFRLAVRSGKLAQQPYIQTLNVQNVRHGFFERWEFDRLLPHLATHLRPLMEFLYLTGWRKQEALQLTWARVDFNAAILRLEPGTTKTDEGRAFPFDAYQQLADLLGAQWEQTKVAEADIGQCIPWVFWRRQGAGVLPVKDYYTGWRNACRKSGINRVPHDFRRTAVRNMERAGLSRSTAMSLTGHKTEAVYRRYAIVAERDQREAVAKLSQLVAGDREKVVPIVQVQQKRAVGG